jgi:adenosylcobinamide-GDP ribazoletransferase
MSDRDWRLSEALDIGSWRARLTTSLQFLTRLPLPVASGNLTLAETMAAFPLAGAIIGALTGLIAAFLYVTGTDPLLGASLTLAVCLLLTGALHEDGLADTADGFGGGATPERKLDIMRDSRIGTYGTLALVVSCAAKIAAIAAITSALGWASILVLAATGAVSRAAIVWLMAMTPPARTDGLSASAGRPDDASLFWAFALAALLAVVFLGTTIGFFDALFALLAAAAVALALQRLAMRMVGGQTGDICGALQVISEIAMLAVISASLH